mgnify:CR=1 FL=1
MSQAGRPASNKALPFQWYFFYSIASLRYIFFNIIICLCYLVLKYNEAQHWASLLHLKRYLPVSNSAINESLRQVGAQFVGFIPANHYAANSRTNSTND